MRVPVNHQDLRHWALLHVDLKARETIVYHGTTSDEDSRTLWTVAIENISLFANWRIARNPITCATLDTLAMATCYVEDNPRMLELHNIRHQFLTSRPFTPGEPPNECADEAESVYNLEFAAHGLGQHKFFAATEVVQSMRGAIVDTMRALCAKRDNFESILAALWCCENRLKCNPTLQIVTERSI